MTTIPGTHTPSSGLAEARERQRAWDERPIPWWDADRHAAERARLGLPPLESTDD